MSDEPTQPQPQPPRPVYEPPRVEDIPTQDGPAVTAAGATGDNAILLIGVAAR